MRRFLRGFSLATAGLLAGCSAGGIATLEQAGIHPHPPDPLDPNPADRANSKEKEPDTPFGESYSTVKGREILSNPTPAEVLQTGPLREMFWGRPDAPVTLIEYASLTCPYCRRFHLETFPTLKRTYIDTGKVRYILREFPIGRSSGTATIALRCVPPEKYLDLFGRFLREQAAWVSQEVRTDAILAVAAKEGLTRAQFEACLADGALIEGLKWVKERGRRLGVIGTPNFFVQGQLVKKVLDAESLRALIEPLLADAGHTALH